MLTELQDEDSSAGAVVAAAPSQDRNAGGENAVMTLIQWKRGLRGGDRYACLDSLLDRCVGCCCCCCGRCEMGLWGRVCSGPNSRIGKSRKAAENTLFDSWRSSEANGHAKSPSPSVR